MNDIQQPKSFLSKYKIALIVLVVVLALAGSAWVNKDYIYLRYAVAKNNTFKPGDIIYADESFFNAKSIDDVIIYQSVSPKSFFPLSNKSYMADLGLKIPGNKLSEHKSAKLGTYVGYKISNHKIGEDFYMPTVYFIIKPDENLLYKENVSSLPEYYHVANGYVKDDDTMYIDANFVTNVESKKITNFK